MRYSLYYRVSVGIPCRIICREKRGLPYINSTYSMEGGSMDWAPPTLDIVYLFVHGYEFYCPC